MLKACQDGEAPPEAHLAFQNDLDHTISGMMHWNPTGVALSLWLKRGIVESFDPEAVNRLFRSHSLKSNPILYDKLPLKSLLELPLKQLPLRISKRSRAPKKQIKPS